MLGRGEARAAPTADPDGQGISPRCLDKGCGVPTTSEESGVLKPPGRPIGGHKTPSSSGGGMGADALVLQCQPSERCKSVSSSSTASPPPKTHSPTLAQNSGEEHVGGPGTIAACAVHWRRRAKFPEILRARASSLTAHTNGSMADSSPQGLRRGAAEEPGPP
ncbi:hypothetical protein HPB48_024580 [Haemaphysalis longicornis]|uniref:Uncharacterized protein n=1 Tax=Haemaphysalis longicornis TaxID=44386 RepID=A0A9J6H8R6_HAELO|nr:hypothetical protein HPB48_024580 [Haemaphysalis longicornis]